MKSRNQKIIPLVGFLAFALVVRAAMLQGPEWSLLLLPPFVFLLGRDVFRWSRRSSRRSFTRQLLRVLTRLAWEAHFRVFGGLPHRTPGRPRGFCPKCGYMMNPGTCPECGALVELHKLRRNAPGKFRRYAGKFGFASAAIILVLSIRHIYFSYDWTSTRSAQSLFGLAAIGNSRAIAELEDRLFAGNLSDDDRTRLLNGALTVRLHVYSPFPSDAWISYVLIVESKLPRLLEKYDLFVRDFDTVVDGLIVTSEKPENWLASQNSFNGNWLLWGPRLEPGSRALAARATVALSAGDTLTDTVDLLCVHEYSIMAETMVEVLDRPVQEFIETVVDPDLQDRIDELIEVSFLVTPMDSRGNFLGKFQPAIQIQNKGLDHAIVGYAEVRSAGIENAEYHHVGRVRLQKGQYTFYCLSKLTDSEGGELPRSIELRIVPDPSSAMLLKYRGVTSFYNQVFTWPELIIPEDVRLERESSRFLFPVTVRTSTSMPSGN